MSDIEVKQIKVGFHSFGKGWFSSNSSVTLIKAKKNILVDTGGRGDAKEIVNALKKEGLTPKDIGYVINTHHHSDHVWNNYLFEKATFISERGKLIGDALYWSKLPTKLYKDIEIVLTPGHTPKCISVIVKTKTGIYAIVGDLIEKALDNKGSCFNKKIREENRNKILKIADYIIPGHAKMFEVKNGKKRQTSLAAENW